MVEPFLANKVAWILDENLIFASHLARFTMIDTLHKPKWFSLSGLLANVVTFDLTRFIKGFVFWRLIVGFLSELPPGCEWHNFHNVTVYNENYSRADLQIKVWFVVKLRYTRLVLPQETQSNPRVICILERTFVNVIRLNRWKWFTLLIQKDFWCDSFYNTHNVVKDQKGLQGLRDLIKYSNRVDFSAK